VLWFAFLQPEDIEAATCRRFRVAARDGDLESIRAMRKSKPDLVFSKDDHAGETPLHYAAAKGHKYVAEFLLSCKADANAKDSAGATPLHYAAAGGRVSVAELLLANKADVNATDGDGETPLHYAVASAHKDVAELLLASGADVDAKDKDGETPFQLAVPRDSLMS
jgi:ankyrin repeat protein